MRPLEVSIAVLLALYLVWRQPRPLFVRLAPAAALILTLIHFALEGYRWQMIPLYALTSLLGISALIMIRSSEDWRHLASYLTLRLAQGSALILLAVSAALPILLPVPLMPRPSGDYPVGTTWFDLTDGSRSELYSSKEEPRKFIVRIWYPADPRPGDRVAPWMADAEIFAPALAESLELPLFFLDHLALVKTPAYLDTPMAQTAVGFPIIIFSHGWEGFNAQNTGQAIELASHGYVVVAVNHTYGAVMTVFPDGEIAYNNPGALPEGAPDEEYEIAARKLVDQWADDITSTLDHLDSRNADSADPYFSRIDMGSIGAYGHSTGGGAAIEFCGRDARCDAVLGLDPFMRPVSLEVLERGLAQPALFMFSQVWAEDTDSRNNQLFRPFYARAQNARGVVSIEGTRHYDFTDMPILSPIAAQIGLKGPINGKEMIRIMNSYLLAFFDETLKGQIAADTPDFPEVKLIQ